MPNLVKNKVGEGGWEWGGGSAKHNNQPHDPPPKKKIMENFDVMNKFESVWQKCTLRHEPSFFLSLFFPLLLFSGNKEPSHMAVPRERFIISVAGVLIELP